MKKKLLLFALCAVVFMCFPSCSLNKSKAKEAINEYMKENLNDFASYEPMLTTVDTLYSDDYIFADKMNTYLRFNAPRLAPLPYYTKDEYVSGINSIKAMYDEIPKVKKEFSGWIIFQKYRASNKNGGKEIMEGVFTADKDFKNVRQMFKSQKEMELCKSLLEIAIEGDPATKFDNDTII